MKTTRKNADEQSAWTPLDGQQFTAIAKALADQRRFKILEQVAATPGPLACCDLGESEHVTPATITHHLKELEGAGLISIGRDGKFAVIEFKRDVFAAYLRQLSKALA